MCIYRIIWRCTRCTSSQFMFLTNWLCCFHKVTKVWCRNCPKPFYYIKGNYIRTNITNIRNSMRIYAFLRIYTNLYIKSYPILYCFIHFYTHLYIYFAHFTLLTPFHYFNQLYKDIFIFINIYILIHIINIHCYTFYKHTFLYILIHTYTLLYEHTEHTV